MDTKKGNAMATSAEDPKRYSTIINEALATVQERGATYADPATNHFRIAQLWSAYLERAIEPSEVAMCMALVKIARLMESPQHDDSYIDLVAYAAIAGELALTDWEKHGYF